MARLLMPSLSDLLFIALLVWYFFPAPAGAESLLIDADLGWHIRAGDYVLQHSAVPRVDLFTFTRPGEAWFAWEWLSDAIFSYLHSTAGLKGVAIAVGLVLAAWPIVVLRHSIWSGANIWFALAATFLALGAATCHFLARPHVFTLLGTAVAAWLIQADRRCQTRRVWWLIPLTALWANLHGGFVVVVVLLGLAAIGSLGETVLGVGQFRNAVRCATLGAACLFASVLNPYGVRLHFHLWQYLQSDWIRKVVREFQAPDFRSESMHQYELLLMGALLITALLLRRRRLVEPLWILAFAHMSLTSARHVPIFAIIAAPIVAQTATEVWSDWTARLHDNSVPSILNKIASDLASAFRWCSVWTVVFAALLALPTGAIDWPADFPARLFPVELVRTHRELIEEARVLTLDQWADYLIYQHYPRQRVFVDGRSDFFGPEVGEEYLRASQGQHGWTSILDRFAVNAVLAPVDWPLAALLKTAPEWHVVADDGRAILFTRIQPSVVHLSKLL